MHKTLHHRSVWSVDALTRDDLRALLDMARSLKHAARAGAPQPLLRGKNLALLCDAEGGGPCDMFRDAATALGAQVARIRPSEARLLDVASVQQSARVLGRLYDAIECEGMPPELVDEVERESAVPVFNGLCGDAHPVRALAALVTMAEDGGKPLSALSLCVLGDPQQPHNQALLRAATLAGMHPFTAASATGIDTDFVWDDRAAAGGDAPLLLATARGDAVPRSCARQQAENKAFVLQALLVSTMM